MNNIYPTVSDLKLSNRMNSSVCLLAHVDFNLGDTTSGEIINLKKDGTDSLPTRNDGEVFLLELKDEKENVQLYQVNDNDGLNYLIGLCMRPAARHYCSEPRLVKVKLVEQ